MVFLNVFLWAFTTEITNTIRTNQAMHTNDVNISGQAARFLACLRPLVGS